MERLQQFVREHPMIITLAMLGSTLLSACGIDTRYNNQGIQASPNPEPPTPPALIEQPR